MADPPDPMTAQHDEDRELAGLYALGALEGEGLATFERHLATCSDCRMTVAEDRDVLGKLGQPRVGDIDASELFKERLLRRAAAELHSAPALPAKRGWSWGQWSPRLAALAAALTVALAAGGVAGREVYSRQILAAAQLQPQGQPVAGLVRVQVLRSGEADLIMEGLPAPGPNHVYEAWAIAPGSAPVPLGTGDKGTGSISLYKPVLGRTIAVTLELAPGGPAPTSPPLFAGDLQV